MNHSPAGVKCGENILDYHDYRAFSLLVSNTPSGSLSEHFNIYYDFLFVACNPSGNAGGPLTGPNRSMAIIVPLLQWGQRSGS